MTLDEDALYILWESANVTLERVKAGKPPFFNSLKATYDARLKQIKGDLV